MRITLENRYVHPAISMLEGMSLEGSQSRARTRLIRLLEPHAAAITEEELDLLKEHATLDDNGEPIVDDDGSFTPSTPAHARQFMAENNDLLAERAQISGGTYEGHREACIRLLSGWDEPVSGTDAYTYDALLTALEEGED